MPFHTATIRWTRNVEADLAGYKIYWGTQPTGLTLLQDVGLTTTPLTPIVTITEFPTYGVLYFGVTAYDMAVPPNESAMSAPVSKAVAPLLFPVLWP